METVNYADIVQSLKLPRTQKENAERKRILRSREAHILERFKAYKPYLKVLKQVKKECPHLSVHNLTLKDGRVPMFFTLDERYKVWIVCDVKGKTTSIIKQGNTYRTSHVRELVVVGPIDCAELLIPALLQELSYAI